MKSFKRSMYDIKIKHFLNLPTSTEFGTKQLNEMQNKIQFQGENFFLSVMKKI